MDNDDLRRGKPTNHKVYGETLAVLAGDALQPEAYRLILTAPGLDESRRAACGRILAEVSGADGMVAGQVLDTLHAPKTEAEVTEVHRLKTGAMIAGACRLGVAAAGGSGGLMAAAETYAQELGLAFQIRDDMLDVCGDAAEFGKPIGSDKEEGKVTFMDLLGLEGCVKAVAPIRRAAKAAVANWDTDGFLAALADSWRSGTSEELGRRTAAFSVRRRDCPHQGGQPGWSQKFTDAYTEYVVYLLDLVIYCMALSGGAVF